MVMSQQLGGDNDCLTNRSPDKSLSCEPANRLEMTKFMDSRGRSRSSQKSNLKKELHISSTGSNSSHSSTENLVGKLKSETLGVDSSQTRAMSESAVNALS